MPDALMTTYKRLPVSFRKGDGAWLWDGAGKRYLDALSGVAVCGLGHAHPAVKATICEQAGELIHTSNLYTIDLQERLGEKLNRLSAMDRAFFCNSGSEANETAIKLARIHGHQRGINKPIILVMENSFHGRTLATLSATGNRQVQAGFEPLVQGFVRAPFGDLDSLRDMAANTPENELEGLPGIREIRGEGLLIGIELDHPCSELTSLALEWGLLIDVRRESVIRLLPPLILSDDQADLLVTTLSELLNGYLTEAVRMRA